MAHSLDETYFEVSTQAPSCSPRCTPHEDSEEAVRYERRRVAQELMSLDKRCDSSSALVGGAIHTRTASGIDRPLSDSLERSRRSPSINSQTSTQQDSSSSGTMGRQSGASSTTTSSWCQSIAKFWSMHISITIDDGAYRDHLGVYEFCPVQDTADLNSARKNILGLSSHIAGLRYDRSSHCTTISIAACIKSTFHVWLFCSWSTFERSFHQCRTSNNTYRSISILEVTTGSYEGQGILRRLGSAIDHVLERFGE